MSELSFFERAVIRALDVSWGAYAGYSAPYTEDLCRGYGLRTTMKILGAMTAALKDLDKAYGATTAQVIVGVSGVWNSCRFCGAGHLFAANLMYFRDTGKLFPLSERDTLELEALEYEEMRGWFAERFRGHDDLQKVAKLIDRLLDFQLGDTELRDADDRRLKQALDMWTLANECSTSTTYDLDVDLVPAVDFINKDKALIARYREARAASQR
ncbi:MAG: hypothetical protein H5U40_14055 [Polyangiaceae bacterium]|nr:hypothetical protein [Polyangiaceae bacterium]